MAENAAKKAPEADDERAVARLREAYDKILGELRKIIVGMDQVIDETLIAIFSQGHVLLVGVPGLAKTLLVSSLAQTLSLSFKRIQFTPDLMPSDITGTEVLQDDPTTGHRQFKYLKGPVFANIILADEINRTPPKTQAALLEAMQEKKISAGGEDFKLDEPFFVLATQNPIEQEGTYPLPEAQQDRFMFKIFVNYPSWDEEFDVIRLTTAVQSVQLKRVLNGEQIIALQQTIRRVPAADHVIQYAMRLVRATRVHEGDVPDVVRDYVSWGAGPRACQYLILGGKVRSVLHGRFHVSTEDIAAVAKPVLRHRIVTNFNADAEGYTVDKIVDRLLELIPAQASAIASNPATAKAVQG